MPITVVGSIAFDTVKTPFGERERMLGGAAVHFALAASFFEDVRVVGPVGEDFGEAELDVLRRRGVDVSDIERVDGGRTFFWQGEYGWDLNSRETLDTQLGVFEGFQPKLSERSRSSDVLFLANIQPELQLDVRAQLPRARFVALDSMNLWIEIARDSLVRAIEGVDCVILNDAELRQLTGKPNLVSAAREILSWSPPAPPAADGVPTRRGPSVIVAKQGEYGAALVTQDGFFALPAYPLETVIDPTGAGDTFAGGFVGYIAAHPREALDDELLRRAMAHATVLASFNVEEFGTERIERLTGEEIVARIGRTARDDPVQRRAAAAAGLSAGARQRPCAALPGPPFMQRAERPSRGLRRDRLALRERYARAGSPEQAQRMHPWLPRRRMRGLYGCVTGYTIDSGERLDLHLADGLPEDPDRGAVPDRALGGPADAGDGAGQEGGIGPRPRPLHPHHPRTRLPR